MDTEWFSHSNELLWLAEFHLMFWLNHAIEDIFFLSKNEIFVVDIFSKFRHIAD